MAHLAGARTNAADFDLNRDGVKLETREVQGLYRNILNRRDPVLLYDSHRMGTGMVGWGVLDATLRALGVDEHPVVYPIFKFRKEAK